MSTHLQPHHTAAPPLKPNRPKLHIKTPKTYTPPTAPIAQPHPQHWQDIELGHPHPNLTTAPNTNANPSALKTQLAAQCDKLSAASEARAKRITWWKVAIVFFMLLGVSGGLAYYFHKRINKDVCKDCKA